MVAAFFGGVIALVGLRILVFSGLPNGFGHDAAPEIRLLLAARYWSQALALVTVVGLSVIVAYRQWKVFPNLLALPAAVLLSIPITLLTHASSSAVFLSQRSTHQQRLDAAEAIISWSLVQIAFVFLVLAYFQMPHVPKGRL